MVDSISRSLYGFIALMLLHFSGCALTDAPFASKAAPCLGEGCLPETFTQFERGRPNLVIDGVGWVFGIPDRLFLWNWGVENHNISIETEQQLQQYVAVNGLQDVKVRLNQYDPIGEWQRLVANKRVGAGWRYTFGAFSAIGYTVFPGRLFGSDYYNPFTNTVSVYSDVPALGLQEVAYAKDVIGRDLPGTYGASQLIPGVNLVHETITTTDVLEYADTTGDLDFRRETVHVLYPNYGSSVGSVCDTYLFGTSWLFQLTGLAAGHISGRLETRGWDSATQPPLMSAKEPTVPAEQAPAKITPVGFEEPAPQQTD